MRSPGLVHVPFLAGWVSLGVCMLAFSLFLRVRARGCVHSHVFRE